jgi:hypothetical protein
MNLVGHLIAADIRRHRWLLMAWLAVIIAAATFELATPMLDANAAVRPTILLLGNLLWLAELLLGVLLVPLTVQTDPLVGSNAFWMTRPIEPDALLASKALVLLGTLVFLPVVLEVAVMCAYHVPAGQLLAGACQMALFHCAWLVAATALAAITLTLARFALLCGAVLMALVIAIGIVLAIAMSRMDNGPSGMTMVQVGDPTAFVVLLLLTIASGAVLLGTQYRTRSRIRSVTLGATGVVVAMLVAQAWPWPSLAPRLEIPVWAASAEARLVAPPDSVRVDLMTMGAWHGARWKAVRAQMGLDGMAPGWSADVHLMEASLRTDGRGDIVSAASGYGTVSGTRELKPVHEAIRAALGVQRLDDGDSSPFQPAVVMTVRESELRRVAPTTGRYRGRFQVVPTRYAIEARLPLRVGVVHQDGPFRAVIEKIEYAPDGVVVEIRESNVSTLFDRTMLPGRSYYLRNLRTSSAMEGSADPRRSIDGPWPFSSGEGTGTGFVALRQYVEWPPRNSGQEQRLTVDERWLGDAELVIVRSTQAQAFERTLEIQDFPLSLPQPSTIAKDER